MTIRVGVGVVLVSDRQAKIGVDSWLVADRKRCLVERNAVVLVGLLVNDEAR